MTPRRPILMVLSLVAVLLSGCGGGGSGESTTGGSGVNSPPTVQPDGAVTAVATTVHVDVLANDSDPDGDALQVESFTQGTQGSVVQGLAGILSYTPGAAFQGTDSFQYVAIDGRGGSATGTVHVTVGSANTAPALTLSSPLAATEDTPVSISGVSVFDTEVAADPDLEVLVSLSAASGTLSLASLSGLDFSVGDGLHDASMLFEGSLADVNLALSAPGFQYQGGPDFAGSDSIFLYVDDRGNSGVGGIKSDNGSITVQVAAVNDPPTALVPADATMREDEDLEILGLQVADPDAGTSPVEVTLSVSSGALSLGTTSGLAFTVGDGVADASMTFTGSLTLANQALYSVTYLPAADFNGTATVTLGVDDQGYTGSPGTPLTSSAAFDVVITPVNDHPDVVLPASPPSYDEDVMAPLPGISAVDVDLDEGAPPPGELEITVGSTNGLFTLGTIPAGLNMTTGDGVSDPTLSFQGTLAEVNTALASLEFQGYPLHFTGVATVVFSGTDGGYTGEGGVKGVPSGRELQLTVGPVNDAPVLGLPWPQTVNEDEYLFVSPVSVSDVDVATGSMEMTLAVTRGTMTIGLAGGLTFSTGTGIGDTHVVATGTLTALNQALASLSYLGDSDYNGGDQLSITVDDLGNSGGGGALTTSGAVPITILPVNDPPVLTPPTGPFVVDEDLPIVLSPFLLTDVDNLTGSYQVSISTTSGMLTLASTAGLTFTPPASGALDPALVCTGSVADVTAALSSITYQGQPDFWGLDHLEFLIDDQGNSGAGGVLSTSITVPVSVTPVNDPPVVQDVDVMVMEDTAAAITLLGSDPDLFDSLTYSIVSSPTHGFLYDFQPTSGAVSYVPTLDYNGTDSFQYQLYDGTVLSNVGTVSVTVTPVNDGLWAAPDTATTIRDVAVSLDVLANDEDLEGEALSIVGVTQGLHGSVTTGGGGVVTYTPGGTHVGFDEFQYTARDPGGRTHSARVLVDVHPFYLGRPPERVSLMAGGGESSASSRDPAVSVGGRWVAFVSDEELVPEDTNALSDVYVYDRYTGLVELVSVRTNPTVTVGNGSSYSPALSPDGRWVAYVSEADNLVAADGNSVADIFLHDRTLAETSRASLTTTGGEANGPSYQPSVTMAGTGVRVVFASQATNLLDDSPVTSGRQVFVRDEGTQLTQLVSEAGGTAGNGDSDHPVVSADGRFVAFATYATDLLSGDTNGNLDIVLYDLDTASAEAVCVTFAGDLATDGYCYGPALTQDGRSVVFYSSSTNLVDGDTNGFVDVFLRDMDEGVTERVSVSSGNQEGGGSSTLAAVSGDGRFVAFQSLAGDLVPGDSNGTWDVFVRDRQTALTERVSVTAGGVQAAGSSFDPAISADGFHVVFESGAPNLVSTDTNGVQDVFAVENRAPSSVHRVSVTSEGAQVPGSSSQVSVSGDGRMVTFVSDTDLLVSPPSLGGHQAVFRKRRFTGEVDLVSEADAEADYHSNEPSISHTGRYVVFASEATNLGGSGGAVRDVFRRDLHASGAGSVVAVSVATDGTPANDHSGSPALSTGGRYVAFLSSTAFSGLDTNGAADVYVRDTERGETRRVSISTTLGGTLFSEPASDCTTPAISGSGRYVAFSSSADGLVPYDTNGVDDVFVHDQLTGVTTRVSVDSSGAEADGPSRYPALSGTGRYVVFASLATNLDSALPDTNGAWDVYRHDLVSGVTERVSYTDLGGEATDDSLRPSISRSPWELEDGRWVAFQSLADDMVSTPDGNGVADVYVRDMLLGTTVRLSNRFDGVVGDGASSGPAISADGRYVGFESVAANLVVTDTNTRPDAFVGRVPGN